MARKESKTWWEVKGQIIARFGSLSACAAHLGCSVEGLRKAVTGECPGIWADLQPYLSKKAVTV